MVEVRSEHIDPLSDTVERTVFRLLPGAILSNIRLINFGFTNHGSSATAASHPVNALGQLACIDSIRLLSGGEQLEHVTHLNIWQAFQKTQETSYAQTYVQRPLNSQDSGAIRLPRGMTLADQDTIDSNVEIDVDVVKSPSDKALPEGWLDLRTVFGVLKAMEVVPNTMLQLSIEITWEQDITRLIKGATGNIGRYSPMITYEYIADGNEAAAYEASFTGVAFTTIESDEYNQPAGDQVSHFQIKNTRNKTVGRLLLASTAPNMKSENYKKDRLLGLGSYIGGFDGVSVIANGVGTTAFETGTTAAIRAADVCTIWGSEGGIVPLSNIVGQDNDFRVYGYQNNQDYYAAILARKIQSLELAVRRSNISGSGTSDLDQPRRLVVFTEVFKALIVNGADRSIVFM